MRPLTPTSREGGMGKRTSIVGRGRVPVPPPTVFHIFPMLRGVTFVTNPDRPHSPVFNARSIP